MSRVVSFQSLGMRFGYFFFLNQVSGESGIKIMGAWVGRYYQIPPELESGSDIFSTQHITRNNFFKGVNIEY